MNATLNPDRLAKLLALASSPNDAEALAALRKTRDHLTAAGLDFVEVATRVNTTHTNDGFDWAKWATTFREREPAPTMAAEEVKKLRKELLAAQQEIGRLSGENYRLEQRANMFKSERDYFHEDRDRLRKLLGPNNLDNPQSIVPIGKTAHRRRRSA